MLRATLGSSDRANRWRVKLAIVLVVGAGIQMVAPQSADAASVSRVTRVGSQLMLDGQPWRFAGVNMYWLGLDDDTRDAQGPTYPSHAKIDEGFAAARTIGATVVRATSLGVSVGSPRSIQPSLGVFNDAAFDTIDYSVAAAARTGIRLMIPLSDMWQYYHGGKHTFTSWRGYTDLPGQTAGTSNQQKELEQRFYTDPTVIADFRTYVARILNHVNVYAGVRLGDDPTIAIWETGNELWDAPPAWTAQTATFIKTLAPRALVADGSAASGNRVANAAVDAADVDIVGGHFYPADLAWARADARVAAQHDKAYIVGEFPLNAAANPDATGWMTALAADTNISGALAWVLMPHHPDGSPQVSGDGYGFHVPGANAEEARQVAVFQSGARLFSPAAVPTPSATPTNLIASTAVTSATSASFFASGGSGGSGPALTTSQEQNASVLRATASSAGYAWVYARTPNSGAPVVAGSTYTASLAVKATQTGSPVTGSAHLTWYDSSGSWLGGSDGVSSPVDATWRVATVSAVAPSRAAWAVPQWQSTSALRVGDRIDLTSFGIARGSVAPATPLPSAASAPANLLGPAVAAASAPSLFIAGSPRGDNGTLARGADVNGVTSVRFTATRDDYAWVYGRSYLDGASVTPGSVYTASLAARPGAATRVPFSAHISWYDSAGAYLGGADGAPLIPSGTGVVTLSVTGTAPARAAWAVAQWQVSATLVSGTYVDLASFRIIRGTG